jgi:polysaccharide biosynthesis/export protein
MKGEQWAGSGFLIRCFVWGICVASVGCFTRKEPIQQEAPIPRELRMTTLPTYVIEPPDILIIKAMNVVPKPPYHIKPLDALYIQASETLPDLPISGAYGIEPDGMINLGLAYGTVRVAGMTLEEAQTAVQEHLSKTLKKTRVQVSLARSMGMQQIQGDHLVRMDGTIGMGTYGSVYVTGMTLDEARRAVEKHLSEFLLAPEISLDVYTYNSKWYYLVMDRAGFGQTIARLPIMGRETVLDALSMMFGTMYMSSNEHIWLARPNGQNPTDMQVFPVNLPAIVQGGSPATNYQLMPGDRLFVQSNPLIKGNNRLNQFLAPIERSIGFLLLGTSAVQSIESTNLLFKNASSSNTINAVGGFR